ncbi:DUF4097 family beta strand repeat-containing protein [Bounagaea algeriensis]
MRTGLAIAGAVLVLVGLGVLGYDLVAQEERTQRYPVQGIEHVRLAGGSGSVAITRAERAEASVEQSEHGWRWPFTSPSGQPRFRVDGSTLVLDADCGTWCQVDYRVVLPERVAVHGELGSGDLDLRGVRSVDAHIGSGSIDASDVAGAVTAGSGSGSIRLSEVGGPVRAATDSGSIDASHLRGERVTARSGSGGIRLADVRGRARMETGSGDVEGRRLAGQEVTAHSGSGSARLELLDPRRVGVDVSSGDVHLEVPRHSYEVRTETGSGRTSVAVPRDPGSDRRLELSTGSGSITVRDSAS